MYDRVRAASKHVKYRFTDSTQPLVFSQISGFSPRTQLINSMPIPSYDISRLPDYDIRPIDVFVPSNIGHESRFNLSGIERCFLHPLTEAIHTNPYISERNSFQIFEELIKDLKIDIETLFEDDRRCSSAVLLNLGIADNNWRHQFRAKEIEEIAYLNPDLNFVVAGTPTPISSLSNVNFIGFRQFSDICNLIANSRSVLHLHPTYFDGVHERPILAPAFGTPVLTRRMRWTSLLRNRSSLGLYDNPTDFRSVFNGLTSNYDRERADAAICENFLHHGTERFLFDLLSD